MDRQLRETIRALSASPTPAISRQYLRLVQRQQERIELTYLLPIIESDHDQIQAQLDGWGFNVALCGIHTEELIDQIQEGFLDDLNAMWGVDVNLPPADHDPEVYYVGYTPNNQIVIIVATLREEFYEIDAPSFWYGIYECRGERAVIVEAWNRDNAPQEWPATYETISENHPGILHVFRNLDHAHTLADVAWSEIEDARQADQLEQYEEEYDAILLAAEDHINAYTCLELDQLPTLAEGQFSNLKIDLPNIRIWLSRMTVEDGMPYDHAVEIEVWNPVEARWVEFAEYPCDPDEQYGNNVIRHID